jgi:hypothetical protein
MNVTTALAPPTNDSSGATRWEATTTGDEPAAFVAFSDTASEGCKKLHINREICVRRVQRTQINVTRALAIPTHTAVAESG